MNESVFEKVVNNDTTCNKEDAGALIKRVFLFLEDGDWNSADKYCERVLDVDPENAQAYLGKLMSEMCVRKPELLKDCATPFDTSNNYQKYLRFAADNDPLKATIATYIEQIKARNEKERLAEEKQRKKTIKIAIIAGAVIAFIFILNAVIIPDIKYNKALALMEKGEINQACSIFQELDDYRDSDDKVEEIYTIRRREFAGCYNAPKGDESLTLNEDGTGTFKSSLSFSDVNIWEHGDVKWWAGPDKDICVIIDKIRAGYNSQAPWQYEESADIYHYTYKDGALFLVGATKPAYEKSE